MENSEELKPKTTTVKDLLTSWTFWKPFIAVSIGAIGGFLYYHFVGCASGTCGITSNPYMSTIFGGLLGYFAVNSPCARGRC
jgi:hypothetical protein